MSTKNAKLNIALDTETAVLLKALAKNEQKPAGTLAYELIREALDSREDLELSLLAEERENEKETIPYEDIVWDE
jgi:hypothetical protein